MEWRSLVPATGFCLRAAPDLAVLVLRSRGLETVDHLSDHQLRDIGLWRDATGRIGTSGVYEAD
jgi:uncharacterized protein YjiS (DUF1127 family)